MISPPLPPPPHAPKSNHVSNVFLRVPFTITAQDAGVRPIINESKAVIGLHPVHRRIGFFNGLGSKGVLHAPFFASQLATLLVDGKPVEYDFEFVGMVESVNREVRLRRQPHY